MFNIVNKKDSIYADIICKPQVQKKAGFVAYEKSTVSMGYDLRTNESRLKKIKMREIKKNDKR